MIRGRGRGSVRAVHRAAPVVLALIGCHGAHPATAAHGCPETGPAIVQGPEDVVALAGCARLPGLVVRTAAPLELSALRVATIDGDLRIGPTLAIGTISLPALTEVRGTVRVGGNGDLSGLFLPALVHAGAVELADDPSLTSVSAPALASIDGALSLARLPALELIETSSLARVGALDVRGVPALVTWVGPPAAVAGAVTIDAPKLDADARAAIDRE